MPKIPVHCPYCEGVSFHLLSSIDVNRKSTTKVFDYYKCSGCELIFLDPRPDDMAGFYKGIYTSIPQTLPQLRAIAKPEQYRMESIVKYKQGGKLLEIGPWIGIFSCNAKDAGFDVTAIEMDPQCVDFLKKIVGVHAVQSSDPAAVMNAMDEKFDVIALWHSLEHLPNPWNVLQKAAERLAPGGILLIAVPNIESYDFSVLKAAWMHLDAPRHFFFYTASSLEKLCSANGLKILELTTSDRLSRLLSRMAWHMRATSIVPVKYIRGILGLLMYQFAKYRSNGNGSGLTAIFTKTE
jgi:2-polyprenyl-3-methyl-5-hydroxy-6-metoxy-1,4-benzoquinol methylase